MTVQQIGQVIRLKLGAYENYKRLHAAVWPDVLATIHKANIRNYSIFYWNGLLFSYMEYVGSDYEVDIASIADDPKTREWWEFTDPLQQPVEGNSSGSIEGNWWKQLEILFHID